MQVPTIRELLARKSVLLGGGHYIPHYDYTGLIANAGFDFIFIDAEHGNRSIESLQHCVNAANAYDVPAIVRANDKTEAAIEQVLDIGAQGVMMPTLETVDDAELLVRAARFAPEGDRGWSSLIRCADYGADPLFHKTADVFVVGLIESPRGFENLDEILKVPGIDAFMPGPGDLTVRMGLEFGDPVVTEMLMTAYQKITDAGKIAWSGGGWGPKLNADHIAAGARMINTAADAHLLRYLRGQREALETELKDRELLIVNP